MSGPPRSWARRAPASGPCSWPALANGQTYTFEGWSITVSNAPVPGSFELATLSYPDQVLAQNRVTEYSVDLKMLDGFFGRVDVSFANPSAVPGGQLQLLRSSSFTSPGVVSVRLRATCATPPGVYPIQLVAQRGGVQKTFELIARVLPGGAIGASLTPLDPATSIPDADATGAVSRLEVTATSWILGHLSVEVNLSHSKIDELTVQLISPSVQVATLHDRQGAGQRDLRRYYDVPEMLGLNAFGIWQLRVIDHSPGNRGFINGWRMRAYDTRRAPSASFVPTLRGRTVAFTDFSRDGTSACHPPGSIVEWRWDFGDGTASLEREPSHEYHAAGEYKVSLTVLDDDGWSDTLTGPIMVP